MWLHQSASVQENRFFSACPSITLANTGMLRFRSSSTCREASAAEMRRPVECRLCGSTTAFTICHRRRKRKFQLTETRTMTVRQSQPFLVETLALGVEDFKLAEERGLRFDLRAVADHDNLHVRRIEVF